MKVGIKSMDVMSPKATQLTEASTNVSAIFLLFRFGIQSYDAHLATVFDAASIAT
jgi:hypothetical protein